MNTVKQLYRDFAWEALPQESVRHDPTLLEQPREILARYFDDTLTNLILADRACVARTEEICRLDFSPIWASQDPGAAALEITPTKDSTLVIVTFTHPSTDERIKLAYHLVVTSQGWRIHDIDYRRGVSLLALLSSKEPS